MSADLVVRPSEDLAPPGPGGPEFDLISRWLISFSSAATRTAYATDVRLWLSWLDRISVDLLDARRPHVDGWCRWQEHQDPAPAPATLARRLAAISSLYGYLVDEDVVTSNPAARVRRPQVSKEGVTKALTADEARALLATAQADGPRSLLLVGLLALNGLRISEALGIDHEHLSEERGHCVARITGKGAKPSLIPLPPLVCHAVALQGRETGPLLLDGYNARMGRGTAASIIDRLGRTAGIGHVHPHMLRVTCVTELLRSHPLEAVQRFARHSDPRTTLMYDRRRIGLDEHLAYAMAGLLGTGEEAAAS